MRLRAAATFVLLVLLAACARVIPENHAASQVPPGAPPEVTALTLGVAAGPDIASLALTADAAAPALAAFRTSCPRLLARPDASGLTRPGDWREACAAAIQWPARDAADFFTSQFETLLVGGGASFVTGYFEPQIAGVRTHQPGFDVPVYGVPPDLVHARPGDAPLKPNGQTPFGRYDESGHFIPYWDRATIEAGKLAGQGLEIAWAADPIEFYFLQVQGSGELIAPDGSTMRIGYAADNGQNYTSIGIVMRDEGLIGTGPGQYPGSMQGIIRYLRDHPEAAQPLMDQNRSWVFFRDITGDGPIGALGVAVKGHVSLAADPLFVPLGAPVFLTLDHPDANGLWVAQDTGGAIKGANRFDSFWGSGQQARTIAGGMASHGTALILVPRGTLARLTAR
ncbi:MAG: MltA domain-containing protein [Sphingomonadales bacterium]|nr:MltA domain-containing protein [Sphingomonadales bacterium]